MLRKPKANWTFDKNIAQLREKNVTNCACEF